MTPQQQQALAELAEKTIEQIQRETAYTWAYRAWAARELATKTTSRAAFLGMMCDATEYSAEAVEHAALAGDEVLSDVRQIVAGIRS